MPIRINITELLTVLEHTPADQNILLVGRHGVGKSEILSAFYQRKSLPLIPLFLGQMSDPGDLIGLPRKNESTGRTEFLPPFWWPQEERPVALFLDELNRARPELLQAVQELALNRTLAMRRLPKGSVVIAAVNAGDEYQVTDLDPALLSRFNVYEFAPEVEEWLAWAEREGLDRRVIAFVTAHGSYLDNAPVGSAGGGGDGFDRMPDRRAWARASALLRNVSTMDEFATKLIAGALGVATAAALRKFLNEERRVRPDQVLAGLDKAGLAAVDALPMPELISLGREVLLTLEERATKLTGLRRSKALANVERYLEHLQKSGKTEALADWLNQLEKPHVTKASGLLLTSKPIIALLEATLQGIKL